MAKKIKKKLKKQKKKKIENEKPNIKIIKEKQEKELEKNNKNEDRQCIICLADYDNEYHIMKKLKCKHTLCESCFNQWYKIKESCPICRKNLFTIPSDRPDFLNIVKDLYMHHDTYFSKDY